MGVALSIISRSAGENLLLPTLLFVHSSAFFTAILLPSLSSFQKTCPSVLELCFYSNTLWNANYELFAMPFEFKLNGGIILKLSPSYIL